MEQVVNSAGRPRHPILLRLCVRVVRSRCMPGTYVPGVTQGTRGGTLAVQALRVAVSNTRIPRIFWRHTHLERLLQRLERLLAGLALRHHLATLSQQLIEHVIPEYVDDNKVA